MQKSFVLVMVCGLVALLPFGCSTGEGAKVPMNATRFDTENKEKFVLMDPAVQQSVTCSGLQEGLTPEGRLEVAANVRNRENRRIEVQINCEFKDAQGFTIDSTPWETLILTENGQETRRFIAMSDKAKHYTIRVRQAR